jgi:hypothetical protein
MKSVFLGAAMVAPLVAIGCNSGSTQSASPVDGATPDGTLASADDGGGSSGEASACGQGTLYTRLGGHAGIRSAVNAIVARELADPDISTYFFNQVASPIPAGHPNADQIEECFADLVGAAASRPGESYPPQGGVTDDAGTFQCRADMMAIHAPLHISGGTFDKFLSIAGSELAMLGVCAADIATLAGALQAQKPAVVSAALADAGDQPFPGSGDGGATDASPCTQGTIYSRLGGHAGIRAAVNAIVAMELADPDISTYFFNQVASPIPAGHPNADQIEQCFADLVGAAVGGAGESYPPSGGVSDDAGTFMCRADMMAIHAPLRISGGTFDKFIAIAGAELTALGVCPADINTLAGALVGEKSAVVTPSLADAGDQPFPGKGDGGIDQ